MPKQRLLVEGAPYEIDRPRSWPSEFADDSWMFAASVALICPRCLRMWAVLAFEGDADIRPEGAYCRRHIPRDLWFSNRPRVPGSILTGYSWDRPLLAALPEPLLRREFELHLQRLEMDDEIPA